MAWPHRASLWLVPSANSLLQHSISGRKLPELSSASQGLWAPFCCVHVPLSSVSDERICHHAALLEFISTFMLVTWCPCSWKEWVACRVTDRMSERRQGLGLANSRCSSQQEQLFCGLTMSTSASFPFPKPPASCLSVLIIPVHGWESKRRGSHSFPKVTKLASPPYPLILASKIQLLNQRLKKTNSKIDQQRNPHSCKNTTERSRVSKNLLFPTVVVTYVATVTIRIQLI